MQTRLDRANQALGRLDGVTLLLPDLDQCIYAFVRKEAVLSLQIEGTQSSLSDLLLFEHDAGPGILREDARETANYIAAALNYGLDQIARPGAPPFSARLLREVHARLMHSGRGSQKAPGEFRRPQNWLGGSRPGLARYVPPPAQEVAPAIAALERLIHDEPRATPILIKAALAHVQFESIHPFLDGNGSPGPSVDHAAALRGARAAQPPAVPQPLFQAPSRDLLRTPSASANRRRLGGLVDVLPAGRD